jgi:flagellar M-ring protein FliF
MADEKPKTLALSAYGFGSLPVARQVGMLVGLAATIAIGVGAALHLQGPDYRSLYSGLSDRDVMAVTDALQKSGIKYELSSAGAVMVPADQVHEARLKLAGQGLPNSNAGGFELLDKEQSFGTSQFMETARYQHALEGELARTIGSIRNVESARVHLAIPKQSVFVREQKSPSVSVLVNLFPGRNLDEGQVAAIVHLVASSVPNLDAQQVTVIDQKGRLLTSPEASGEMGVSSSQFAYRKKLEEYFTKRIEALLEPIVGLGGVRAQVTTELDYTSSEQTQETFNPDLPSVRSEQTAEEKIAGVAAAAGGVPGALTNQPPAGGTTTPQGGAAGAADNSTKSNRRVTRNFELDRTISHARVPAGTVRRLAVAVVVDDKQSKNEQGEVQRQAYTEEELARLTTLVKEAVGFSVQRGDSVSVINTAFTVPTPAEPLPEIPLVEQPWLWQALRIAAVVIVGMLGFLMIVRPTMRTLAEKAQMLPPPAASPEALAAEQQLALPGGAAMGRLPPPDAYENNLNTAKSMVQQDPKRVAQVVKQWVGEDGG